MSASKMPGKLMIVSGLLALVFFAAGLTKVMGLALPVEMFHRFGLPPWVLLTVGVLEIAGALLLFSSTTRPYAATGLALLMIGASLAHVMTGVMLPMLFLNAALCFTAGWVLMQHRPVFFEVKGPA